MEREVDKDMIHGQVVSCIPVLSSCHSSLVLRSSLSVSSLFSFARAAGDREERTRDECDERETRVKGEETREGRNGRRGIRANVMTTGDNG